MIHKKVSLPCFPVFPVPCETYIFFASLYFPAMPGKPLTGYLKSITESFAVISHTAEGEGRSLQIGRKQKELMRTQPPYMPGMKVVYFQSENGEWLNWMDHAKEPAQVPLTASPESSRPEYKKAATNLYISEAEMDRQRLIIWQSCIKAAAEIERAFIAETDDRQTTAKHVIVTAFALYTASLRLWEGLPPIKEVADA